MLKRTEKNSSGQKKRQDAVVFLCLAALVLTIIYINIRGLVTSYVDSFILQGSDRSEAVANLKGLDADPSQALVAARANWDNWRYSRLRDEVTVSAADGVSLHGYYYDEGSDTVAIFVPRYSQDGTADFLLAPWLNEETACSVLVIDPRTCGASGGNGFSYGFLESADLSVWVDWAEETLGSRRFIVCGEGAGANTVLFAASSGLLEGREVLAVAESPFGSFREQAAYTLKESYQLPAVPFLSMMERKANRAEILFDCADMELSAALTGSSARVPVLFLSSSGDTYIPAEMTRAAYEAYPGEKILVSGSGAHGTVTAEESAAICETLTRWLAGE